MKKLAVITGASSGIGLALAKELSKLGHPLLLLARRFEKIEEANLPNVMIKKVDVRNVEDFKDAVKEAEDKYGDVDLLVNNAGLMQFGDTATQDISEWNNMIDINIKGVLNGCHIVLERMKEKKTGTIINISSLGGVKSVPGISVYCGTKFAVTGFTEGLRQEVCKDNIRIISICPGAIATELLEHTTEEKYKPMLEEMSTMPDALIQAKDVAQTIAYIYGLPQNVSIRELIIAPTKQEL